MFFLGWSVLKYESEMQAGCYLKFLALTYHSFGGVTECLLVYYMNSYTNTAHRFTIVHEYCQSSSNNTFRVPPLFGRNMQLQNEFYLYSPNLCFARQLDWIRDVTLKQKEVGHCLDQDESRL